MNFSFLGGLASLLPGYIQGQRMANQDNWQDLMNYNQVQQGQLSNLFTEATWQPRMDMFRNSWIDSHAQTYGNLENMRLSEIMRPYREQEALWYNYYSPQLAPIGAQSLLKQWQMSNSQPNLMSTVAGNTPSGLGG